LVAEPHSDTSKTQAYLPDFCTGGAVFVVVLVAELVAILLTLAAHDTPGMFMIELAKTSLFVLWLGILAQWSCACFEVGWKAPAERTLSW